MTNAEAKTAAIIGGKDANGAPNKGKSKNTAAHNNNAPKRAVRATKKKGCASKKAAKPVSARDRSKKASVLALLERKDGATLAELMKATGWQAHSVRGFLSGALGKKMGLAVASTKGENGDRRYAINA